MNDIREFPTQKFTITENHKYYVMKRNFGGGVFKAFDTLKDARNCLKAQVPGAFYIAKTKTTNIKTINYDYVQG